MLDMSLLIASFGPVWTCFVVGLITTVSGFEMQELPSVNRPNVDNSGFVHYSKEYVRCFCNLPNCVATGYMCKSSARGCFSDLLEENQATSSKDYRGIHGCVELLQERDQKKWCPNNPNNDPTKSTYQRKIHPKSLLLCCYHDMCNHADSPSTRNLFNETAIMGEVSENEVRLPDPVGTKQDTVLYTESEVWFRAATIAVPICGAVILLALIVLAIRLLRTETSGNARDKLGVPPYMVSSDRKVNRHHNHIVKDPQCVNPLYANSLEDSRLQSYLPLLVQSDSTMSCNSKNETNAKLNFMQDYESGCANAREDGDGISPEFYKNADLHIGRNTILSGNSPERRHDGSNLVKVYDKEVIS